MGDNKQPIAEPVLPRLYVTKTALAEMATEVLAHPSIETAWGLYGFRYPKAVFVVGVLRPVASEVVRGYANASAGGQEMVNAMRWLHANERLINQHVKNGINQGKFGFLYKGHSHHTLGFGQYSSVDHSSIYQAVKDDGLEVAVGPLALIKSNGASFGHAPFMGNVVSASRYSRVEFVFYLLTKEMVEYGLPQAVVVRPTIIETVKTLLVPPLGWEFAQNDEFKEQLRHLNSWGCQVKVNHIDSNGKPPLEIQFVIDRVGFKATLVITTDWNYPEAPPRIQLLPKDGSMTWEEANKISAMQWWSRGDDFIDIIGRMLSRSYL